MIFGQSSFRRILLSRLLLLSVPILFMGVYVSYRKARSVFLDSARKNLTESAVRQGESIRQSIEALRANLVTASDAVVLKLNSPQEHQAFVEQFSQQLSTKIACVQLINLQTQELTASTCGKQSVRNLASSLWPQQQNRLLTDPKQIHVSLLPPAHSLAQRSSTTALNPVLNQMQALTKSEEAPPFDDGVSLTAEGSHSQAPATIAGEQVTAAKISPCSKFSQSCISTGEKVQLRSNRPYADSSQLHVLLGAPVYDLSGQLRYALAVESALLLTEKVEPGLLEGYPVVINQQGTILTHPFSARVGRNIEQEADAERLKSLMKGALAGRQDFFHLFSLQKDGQELLAGYSAIPSPVTSEPDEKWIILAVTPLDSALAPLKDFRQVLVILMVALIGASLLATLYVSRELARPLEKLRDYALHTEHLHSTKQIPPNFGIREFNQLSVALKEMVERLKAWGEEIVSAWKEAQNANQLKNEFLATTSHELRTPLNGIIGCIRVIKDGYCDSREEEMEFLQKADEAAVHLLGIINDILDISKIEAGKLSVLIEKVSLRKVLNEVIDLQAIPIRKKGLVFKTPQWQKEIVVYADPAKLKQVLLNVLGNAVKFTESGSIEIAVRLEQKLETLKLPQSVLNRSALNLHHFSVDGDNQVSAEDAHLQAERTTNGLSDELFTADIEGESDRLHSSQVANLAKLTKSEEAPSSKGGVSLTAEGSHPQARILQGKGMPHLSGYPIRREGVGVGEQMTSDGTSAHQKVVITVKDTGIGIDPSQQDKLFRPFVMVDGSTTRKFGGTGLGLAISRNLIELMGGQITLFSSGLGKGTTVEIKLSIAETSPVANTAFEASSANS